MSGEAAALRAEAAAMMAEPEPAESVIVKAGEGDDLLPAVAGALQVIGNPLCDRYRVTRLEGGETETLAGALLNVARVYGWLDKADPKIMALLTLGGVSATILANRRRLPPPEPAPEPANADAAAAA